MLRLSSKDAVASAYEGKNNMWTAYMKEKYCNGLPISAAPPLQLNPMEENS